MRSGAVMNVGPGSFTGAANQHCHPSGESPKSDPSSYIWDEGRHTVVGLLSRVGPPPYTRSSVPTASGMAGSCENCSFLEALPSIFRAHVTLALTMMVLTDSGLGLPSTSTCRQSDKVEFHCLSVYSAGCSVST